MVENTVDMLTLINREGIILYQNPASEIYLGWQPQELLGTNIFDYVNPADVELALAAYAQVAAGENQDRIVVRFRHKNGSERQLEVVGSLYREEDNESMILSARDVTEQAQTIEKLAESEELLRAAFNTTGSVVVVMDLESPLLMDVNPAFERVFGVTREQCVGRTALDLGLWRSAAERDEFLAPVLAHGRNENARLEMLDSEGNRRVMMADAVALTLSAGRLAWITAQDITHEEEIAEQLRQSQRMEAVGQLTGGIAHDFNNMLNVILGHIDLSRDRYLSQKEIGDILNTIRSTVGRGADLVRKLMAFSRNQQLNPTRLVIGEVLGETIELLSRTLGASVSIHVDTDTNHWPCEVDRGMLENAIVNLAINARDAIRSEGNIAFIASDRVSPEIAGEVIAGDFVLLQIIDNGSGMKRETLASAIEPFFTTKAVGEGTGLGLSMVYGFVKQSGGHFHIASTPGSGTTISILLPRAYQS